MLIYAYRDADGTERLCMQRDAESAACTLLGSGSLYELAVDADRKRIALVDAVAAIVDETAQVDLAQLARDGRLLSPIRHPDPAHMYLTGTGLTHRASAESRDRMHAASTAGNDTDTIRMYRIGEEGGRCDDDAPGAAPEWFYKGDGSTLVAPGAALESPCFALDGGEETEVAGIYLIGHDGTPRRIGFALANEFSDHVIEKANYLYLAHSKLRPSSIGPAILLGDLPETIAGSTRIRRGGETIWEAPFASGEAHMCHEVANLEHHHFKYELFRRPGDLHVHYFGAATVSFGDGITIEAGDTIEIASEAFGAPLFNTVTRSAADSRKLVRVTPL
ncbi:Fumarylacetoacetate (FAA) hydrolase family protein [Tsuneonella dongtanensis]|uniref:Fumarylacetoacetate (FAA) hydrolase family protein n=1 Tax=Tsuneonella dongtanensis TaxID=692370 RepID=A0A1B2ABA6_9SPHN|nr:Fumarylacetoacetate (FAA) hydrolase family protein [Tsuneonella dongtanensis]